MNHFEYSKTGLVLTEKFEADGGPRLQAYVDPLKNGLPTIGWGHTGKNVHLGMTWTREQCEEALVADVHFASNIVNRLVSFDGLNQDEFDALVDLVYNCGAGSFASSTLLKDLNSGNIKAAAEQFEVWSHASGKVVAGLLRRRIAEQREFEQGGRNRAGENP